MKKNKTKEFLKSIINFIFPQFCIACGKYGTIYCEDCIEKHTKYDKQRCFICNKFSKNGITHLGCKTNISPDQLIVATKYNNLEKKIIHNFKYKNKRNLAKPIAQIIYNSLKNKNFKNYVICPIPLHKDKLKKRGFNQVELIGNELKALLNLPMKNFLTRKKNTKSQSKLNRKERIKNLENAFKLKENKKTPSYVILLDDLTTSGATFREASKVLKENGVKKIICLAFARGK